MRNFHQTRSPRHTETDLSLPILDSIDSKRETRWFQFLLRKTRLSSYKSVGVVESGAFLATYAIESGSTDRFPDHECGAGLVLYRARLISPGRLPERVQDVRDGVTCPECGGVIWEARALTNGDLVLVIWERVMSLAELRSRDWELERIKSFEQIARDEIEGEARYLAQLALEQSNNNEGNNNG